MDMKTKGAVIEESLVDIHLPMPTIKSTDTVVAEAESLIIDCPEMLEDNGHEMTMLKGMINSIEEERKALVKPIDESRARVQAFFKRFSDPLEMAYSIRKEKTNDYLKEQKRIEMERQRQADIAAAEERARLAKEAAIAEAKAREEEERLRAEAEAAAAEGNKARAAELAAQAEATAEAAAETVAELHVQAASTVSAVVSEGSTKVAGVSKLRDNWKAVVEDESKVPREFLMVDEKKLNAYAKAMKEAAKVDGVRFYNDASVAVRGAK